MNTGSASDRKAMAWRKAIAALLAQPATEDYRRLRSLLRRRSQSWQFLAWTYIIAKVFGTEWSFSEKAIAADHHEGRSHINHETVDAPSETPESNNAVDPGVEILQDVPEPYGVQYDDAVVAPVPQSSGFANFGDGQVESGPSLIGSVELVALPSYSGGGGVSLQISIPQIVFINPVEIIQPDLPFFDGLAEFTQALGFDDLAAAFGDSLPDTVLSQVLVSFEFAESPFAPLLAWQSSGALDAPGYFTNFDSFDTDWTIQANGIVDGHQVQLQSSNEDGLSSLSQRVDSAGHIFGNSATLVDGQDWDGQLNVFGNYYEFNTIIQVNVLWDNDSVSAFSGFGNEFGATHINTGNNTQENFAQIVDVNAAVSFAHDDIDLTMDYAPQLSDDTQDHVDAPHLPVVLGNAHGGAVLQVESANPPVTSPVVVAGGVSEHFQSVQLNDIIDLDEITLSVDNFDGISSGSADTVKFADLTPGGHSQSNDSLFVTDPLLRLEALPSSDFRGNFDGPNVENVFGHFYEFNTVIQFNFIDDIDEFNALESQAGIDGANGSGAIASGGNLVFNEATILKNDHFDNLFVGGQYTEFNLVLQLNFIEDADSILQIASPFLQALAGSDSDPSEIVTGMPGSNGSHGNSTDFEMSGSTLDEIAMRSSSIDVLM